MSASYFGNIGENFRDARFAITSRNRARRLLSEFERRCRACLIARL
jgi:hypothetical protein